jgi:hypothetical protein
MRNLNIFVNGNGVVVDLGDKLPVDIEDIERSQMETVDENYLHEVVDCDSVARIIIPHNLKNNRKIAMLRKELNISNKIKQTFNVYFIDEMLRYRTIKTFETIKYQKIIGTDGNEYVEKLNTEDFYGTLSANNVKLALNRHLLNEIIIGGIIVQTELLVVNHKLYFVLSAKNNPVEAMGIFANLANEFDLEADITTKNYYNYFNNSK